MLRSMLGLNGDRDNTAQVIETAKLQLSTSIESHTSFFAPLRFRFINLEHQFEAQIDWNFAGHGKLWVYNLNYFDFLQQAAFPPETGVLLMKGFAKAYEQLKDAKEPYPTSLRIVNWISFIARHDIADETINRVIHNDLIRLNKNVEYHLMGNHLMENAFALLYGAVYFRNEKIYRKSRSILHEQLEEQVLTDGAHFELSPMYHKIILARLVATIDLLKSNNPFQDIDLLKLMVDKAELMLGWLLKIRFQNGSLPAVNDSTEGIAPDTDSLFDQAKELELKPRTVELGVSGYRKRAGTHYELLADVGNIGPDYIPGHAHSDTLNFLLNVKESPIIVDSGISTYEKNALRSAQRGTAAHNTVMVNDKEQTEVWGGFRVARRAKATVLEDTPERLVAFHDGYRKWGQTHQRSFDFSDDSIRIQDKLSKPAKARAFLHFHPGIELELTPNGLRTAAVTISFEGATAVELDSYQFAEGFNLTTEAQRVVITFSEQLTTNITVS